MDNKTKKCLTIKLMYLFGSIDLAERWWYTPNLHFAGATPNEMLDVNEQEVIKYINHQFI